jgi:hypothetical protein
VKYLAAFLARIAVQSRFVQPNQLMMSTEALTLSLLVPVTYGAAPFAHIQLFISLSPSDNVSWPNYQHKIKPTGVTTAAAVKLSLPSSSLPGFGKVRSTRANTFSLCQHDGQHAGPAVTPFT